MERIGNKISYIRKPLARYSYVSAGLTAACYLLGGIAVALSYQNQGNAPLVAAALGFCSILVGGSAIAYGIFSFFEKEKNYLLAKISLVIAGIGIGFWLVVIVVACYLNR